LRLILMKVKTIADALKCASKVNAGQACSAAEMRATVKLLSSALKTAKSTASTVKKQLKRSDDMVARLLSKVGL